MCSFMCLRVRLATQMPNNVGLHEHVMNAVIQFERIGRKNIRKDD